MVSFVATGYKFQEVSSPSLLIRPFLKGVKRAFKNGLPPGLIHCRTISNNTDFAIWQSRSNLNNGQTVVRVSSANSANFS